MSVKNGWIRKRKKRNRWRVMSYFPMFVDMKDKKCLVVGGGNVAYRKIVHMKNFEALITVVSPEIISEIRDMQDIEIIEKSFEDSGVAIKDYDVVISATNDSDLNHRISQECQELKIPVNVVDCPSECSFIFPAYIKKGDVVAAFSSGGKGPVITQYLKKESEDVVTEWLGEIADFIGSKRDKVKEIVPTEKGRKKVYKKILEVGLQEKRLMSEEEIMEYVNYSHL